MKKLIKLLVVMFLMTFSMAFKPVTTKAIEAPESISVQGYVRSLGWTDWNNYGSTGYSGRNLPLEGIKLKLSSDLVAKGQHIKYRVHVQDIGWMDWVQDGEVAGAPEKDLPIEAFQAKVVDEDGDYSRSYDVSYSSHSYNDTSMTEYHSTGSITGTVGKGLPLETLSIEILQYTNNCLDSAYCSLREGWHEFFPSNSVGTIENADPLTGVKFRLPKNCPDYKNTHIAYRVHVQNIGWMDWVQDGQVAGAPERNLPIEAIQIKIVDNYGAKKMPFTISYKAHISNIGWEEKYVKDGETAGTVGKALPIEAIAIDFDFPKLAY